MKKVKSSLITLIIILLTQGHCSELLAQQTSSEEVRRSRTNEFQETLKDAEAGNIFAMDQVAEKYRTGNGVSVDYNKAMYWFKKVAEKGFPEAQFSLGSMYYFGEGVPENKKLAYEWLYKAATSSQEMAPASYNIAVMYSKGEYVKADEKKAVEWYRKAAKNTRDYPGVAAKAQNAMGESYFYGLGVKKDIEMAYAWFWFAQKYGNDDASKMLKSLNKKMTPQQIRNAREKANKINQKQRIMLDPPFPVLDIVPAVTKSTTRQNCPDLKGTYQSDINSTRLYLQKQNSQDYRVVLNIRGYPLTLRNAHIVGKDQQQNQPYTRLPDCTLSIDNFGQLLPHIKGTAYHLHFDSQDLQKVFNTDFVLKIDDTPDGVMGMNKASADISPEARDALNKQ